MLLSPILLASCSSPPASPDPVTQAPVETMEAGNDWQKIDQAGIEKFRKEFGAFEVGAGYVPDFAWREIKRLSKRMPLLTENGMNLTLDLGKRYTVKESGRYRTTSRYQLTDSKGRRRAEAESLIDVSNIGSKDLPDSLSVLYDTGTRSFFVAEDYTWSNRRFILMESTGPVKYLMLPEREAMPPHLRHSYIKGFKDGLVYFETEGRTYAMPIAQLKEESTLEFSIG
ncbi:MAG TPA: hypothetical protein VG796_17230 [Verrucomicrobiales bacterium]|nr:hypothetical protein [Verrucomicrobiales bacterium]